MVISLSNRSQDYENWINVTIGNEPISILENDKQTFTLSFRFELTDFEKSLKKSNNEAIYNAIFEIHKDDKNFKWEWNQLHYKKRWKKWINKIVDSCLKYDQSDALIKHIEKHMKEKSSINKKCSTINLFIIYGRIIGIDIEPPKKVDYSKLVERLEHFSSKIDVPWKTLEDGTTFIKNIKVSR